jgi:hypothetical protein
MKWRSEVYAGTYVNSGGAIIYAGPLTSTMESTEVFYGNPLDDYSNQGCTQSDAVNVKAEVRGGTALLCTYTGTWDRIGANYVTDLTGTCNGQTTHEVRVGTLVCSSGPPSTCPSEDEFLAS